MLETNRSTQEDSIEKLTHASFQHLAFPERELPDPLSATLFSRRVFPPFDFPTKTQEKLLLMLSEVFERDLDIEALGNLIGAPDGASLRLEMKVDTSYEIGRPYLSILSHGDVQLEKQSVHVELYRAIFHPHIDETDSFYHYRKDEWTDVYCRNWSTDIYPTGSGVGTRVFLKQVQEMTNSPIPELRSRAIRNDSINYNGYYTWASLGYEIRFDDTMREQLKAAGFNVDTNHDLFSLPGGRSWWKKHGTSSNAVFSLNADSMSQQILQQKIYEKGIRLP